MLIAVGSGPPASNMMAAQKGRPFCYMEVMFVEQGYDIPFWMQYTLSVDEAAKYFRIGQNTLRKIISDNPEADYLLWIGRKAQIKRSLFEKYIDQHNVV